MKNASRVLNVEGFSIHIYANRKGTAESDLVRTTCPFCGDQLCIFDCDQSQAEGSSEEVQARLEFNAGLDMLESLILAHACEGVNVEDERYRNGIRAVLDAMREQLNLVEDALYDKKV
jgi:hypothetical protein